MFSDKDITNYNSCNTILIDKLQKELLNNNIYTKKKYNSSLYTYFQKTIFNKCTLELLDSKYVNTFIDFDNVPDEDTILLKLRYYNFKHLSDPFVVKFKNLHVINYNQCVKAIEFFFDCEFTPVQLSMFDNDLKH